MELVLFLEVNTMYQTYLLAEAAMEYLICLFSSHTGAVEMLLTF